MRVYDLFNGQPQLMVRPIDTHDGSMQEEPTASHLVVEMWSAAARTSCLSR